MRLLKVKEKPAQSLRPARVFLWNNFVFLFFQWKKYCHWHHVWHKQLLKQRLSWQSHRFWISWQIFPNHRTNINVKYRQLSSNVAFKKKIQPTRNRNPNNNNINKNNFQPCYSSPPPSIQPSITPEELVYIRQPMEVLETTAATTLSWTHSLWTHEPTF